MRVATILSIVSILGLVPLAAASAAEPQPTLEQIRRGKIRGFPQPETADVALIKEGNRVFRVASRYDWPRIGEVFPTPTLLIGDSHEYLMGHPAPPDPYYLVSRVEGFHMFAYGRDSSEPCPQRSTARPIHGAPTIVMGAIECYEGGPTSWIFNYARCSFRLYLYLHNELLKVSRLELPFPDPQERWKQTFPFPWDDPEVITAVRELGNTVSRMYWTVHRDDRLALFDEYLTRRERLREILDAHSGAYSADDFLKYVSWGEGIPHFITYQSIELAGRSTRRQLPEVRELEGYMTYGQYVARELRPLYNRFRHESSEPITFEDIMILGALTAGVIDALVPDWQQYAVQRDVWLEDLMAAAAQAN